MAKNILIVKIGAIGDVVMSLPLLTHLRKKEQAVHISWICGKIVEPLLREIGLIDQIFAVDEKRLLTGNVREKILEILSLWRQVGGKGFDLVLTAHVDPRYRILTLPIRKKRHVYFDRSRKRKNFLPGRYHGYEYLRLLEEEPLREELKWPSWTSSLPKKYAPLFQGGQPVVALTPGGAKNPLADNGLRRWPIAHYVSLSEQLLNRGIKVLLTGSETDVWCLPHFALKKIENLIGETTLVDLVTLFKHCDLVACHDSGPLHLAHLGGASVIALFGPTNPQEFNIPGKGDVIWGGENLPCRPCYDGKTFAPCKNNVCLRGISVDKVLEKILTHLGVT